MVNNLIANYEKFIGLLKQFEIKSDFLNQIHISHFSNLFITKIKSAVYKTKYT